MRYFLINTMGDSSDQNLCFLTESSEGLGSHDYRLALGERMGKDWPEDACLIMDQDFPGLKLASLLGNSCNLLIVHRGVQETIASVCRTEIEFLPLVVLNHRKKVASGDYVIVNLIGTIACLDEQASKVERNRKGKVISMGKPVVDKSKVPPGTCLFRPAQAPSTYIMDSTLARALVDRKPTNFVIDELKTTI